MFESVQTLESSAQKLRDLLLPFSFIWQRSILQDPRPLRCPGGWIEILQAQSASVLATFDNEGPLEGAPEDLSALLHGLEALSCRPLIYPNSLPIEEAQNGISAKKVHETTRIATFLAREDGPWRDVVDVGGGVGHLARAVMRAIDRPVLSIDRQAHLQERGRAWNEPLLHFHRAEVGTDALSSYFGEETLSIGLHTCGELSWQHLELSRGCRGLLNFPCCYHQLRTEPLHETRSFSFPLSPAALFLATRGRKDKTPEEFALQRRVQSYRFGLHLLLLEVGVPFRSMGHAPQALYAQSFLVYVRDRLEGLESVPKLASTYIEDFFAAEKTQQKIRELFLCDLLRNRFSRPLEVLLLLDRAIWLAKQPFRVGLAAFFDRGISPRNLGIYALRL